jgi:hypothetical protein
VPSAADDSAAGHATVLAVTPVNLQLSSLIAVDGAVASASAAAAAPALAAPALAAPALAAASAKCSGLTLVLSRLVQLQACLDDINWLQAARLNGATHGACAGQQKHKPYTKKLQHISIGYSR